MSDVSANKLEMLKLTMPCKTIDINNKPYLNRFFVSQDVDGTQEWLYEYVCADSEPHLHSYPWQAISTVLSGGYMEESQGEDGAKKRRFYGLGAVKNIQARSTYCITKVFPSTWTLLGVDTHCRREQTAADWLATAPRPECANSNMQHPGSFDWWKTAKTLNGAVPVIFYPCEQQENQLQFIATTISHYIEAPLCQR